MSFPEFATDDPVALEVERAAFEVYPLLLKAGNRVLREQYAIAFANILGEAGEFHQYVSGSSGERLARIDRLLETFRHNADLLISKTWVEKHDQKAKEAVHESLASFVQEFRQGAVARAFPHFVDLSRGIARLLFGDVADLPEFIAYAFRIDPKLGLFYWYVEQLGAQRREDGEDEVKVLELMIGIYFLASF